MVIFCKKDSSILFQVFLLVTDSSSSLFLFPSHIQQLRSTDRAYILLLKVNGYVDGIKEKRVTGGTQHVT